jgi:hypothetical protein
VGSLLKRNRSAVKAQKGRRMNVMIIHGAFTEIVSRLYRNCTSFARRFYGALQLQRNVSATRAPCERRKKRSGSAARMQKIIS